MFLESDLRGESYAERGALNTLNTTYAATRDAWPPKWSAPPHPGLDWFHPSLHYFPYCSNTIRSPIFFKDGCRIEGLTSLSPIFSSWDITAFETGKKRVTYHNTLVGRGCRCHCHTSTRLLQWACSLSHIGMTPWSRGDTLGNSVERHCWVFRDRHSPLYNNRREEW